MSAGARPLVGVVGGVGPLATVYFCDLVVRLTEADRDQAHVDMIVFNHAAIPDRTAFVLGESTEDPGPVMAEDARRLERFGASFVVIPCNTAHHFTDEVTRAVGIPVLSIVDETVEEVRRRSGGSGGVGILATSGTIASGVYQRALAAVGADSIVPEPAEQAEVMRVIYEQVKAGLPGDVASLAGVARSLVARGAQVVVMGCTELSVVARDNAMLDDPLYVDSLDVLARRTIERAGAHVRR